MSLRGGFVVLGLLVGCGATPVELLAPPPQPDTLACAGRACGDSCGDALACDAAGVCTNRPVDCTPPPVERVDGWDDPPGSGDVYVFSHLAIARDGGFDVDGTCRAPGDCADNALAQLSPLFNDQIRQSVFGGEMLMLIEFAGLDDPARDTSLTVKVYIARDADDPPFPSNNLMIPAGEERCCDFVIDPDSLERGQARARLPARAAQGWVSLVGSGTIPVGASSALPAPFRLVLEQAQLKVQVTDEAVRDGVMGGAVSVPALAVVDNPFCKTLSSLCPRQSPGSSMLDLIAAFIQPDIDRDVPPDGLERLAGGSTGRVEECFDGCNAPSNCAQVAPLDAARPETCALNPKMRDGYSIALDFEGIRATARLPAP